MALIRSKGGVVLNKYLVARVFAFDDHASEARAACVAKGWEDVRRGPPLLIDGGWCRRELFPLRTVDPNLAFSVDRLVWAVDGANAALCYVIKDQFVRRPLDLYGLWGGTRTSEFSSDRSILVVTGNNNKLALYDVTDGGTRRLVAKRTVVAPPPPFLQFEKLSISPPVAVAEGRRGRRRGSFSRRKLSSSAKSSSRTAVVTPDDKENAPVPFSAELAAGVSDGSECKQS